MSKRKAEQDNDLGDGKTWSRGLLIGKGSYGSVFMANSKRPRSKFSCFPKVFAVKSAEVSVSGSLQKEKEAMNNLYGCPHIIRCFGEEITDAESGKMVYNLLLEYASGGTLAELIEKSGGRGLPEEDVRRYTRSIIQGLNYIHSQGYVHCDIKPENILLVPSSPNCEGKLIAKIGDFGLAKRAKQGKNGRLDPYLRGTPLYLSPEVVIENEQQQPSDIWALGCLVLEMLTGKPVWNENGECKSKDILDRIADVKQVPVIPDEISKEGKEFLQGCLQRKVVSRLTAEMLLNTLFVSSIGEDGDEENLKNAAGELDELSESEEEEDVFYFSNSDGCSYSSESGSVSCSWSDEADDFDDEVCSSPIEKSSLPGQTEGAFGAACVTPKTDCSLSRAACVQ